MSDDIIVRDDNGDLAVNTVVSTEANVPYNYDDCFTLDTNGRRALRVVGSGGGGDQHNLGYYSTQAALEEAHPTAEAGDFAIVGATDTVWIWDTDTSAWKDSDQKGQVVSVNSKTGTVVLNAKDVSAIPQVTSMPTVTEETIVQYVGTTNASYTNGYFYKATGTTTYTGTVSFDPASISGTTATCSGDDFAGLVAEYGTGNITDIIKGTLTYDLASDLLVFVGLDDTDTQVCTFQLYTQDYTDAGFVFTGTLADGDVIAFTCTVAEGSTTYSWSRIDVQPAPEALPSQTGQSGKFLTTNGTDASWSNKPLVNNATQATSLAVIGRADALTSVVIGVDARAYNLNNGSKSVAIGNSAETNNIGQVAIGYYALPNTAIGGIAIGMEATIDNVKHGAMQFGKGRNSESGTVCFGLTTDGTNYTNYKLLSADGTVPTARLTNAINKYSSMPTASADYLGQIVQFTGTTDATYTHGYIYECVSDGGNPATYSWTAVSVQAGGGNYLPITGGTLEGDLTMGTDPVTYQKYAVNFGNGCYLKADPFNTYTLMLFDGTTGVIKFDAGSGAIYPSVDASGYHKLGMSNLRWTNVYTTKINNGADINIPTTGGTMAVINIPSTTPTLAVADWSSNTQTITVTGVTASNVVLVSPAPSSASDYASAGIICTAQGTDSLTFTCDTVPTNAIDLSVVIL